MYDIDTIKANNPIESVVASYLDVKRNKALCPFHDEKTPSFVVRPAKQTFSCYGCGEYGDVIDFVSKFEGVTFTDACAILGGEKKAPDDKDRPKRRKQVAKSIYDGIKPIVPVPAEAELIYSGRRTPKLWNPNRENYTTYKPSMVFEYHTPDGLLLGYVLRVDFDDTKITPSIMWCERNGEQGWCHYSFPEPRPLYGLPRLAQSPDTPVLIVEGEKAADAAHKLLPAYVVVTWSGGTHAINRTNWSVLEGRKVLIWPDADEQGVKAAEDVAQKALDAGAKDIKIINVMAERIRKEMV